VKQIQAPVLRGAVDGKREYSGVEKEKTKAKVNYSIFRDFSYGRYIVASNDGEKIF
jgi:hypothetical protein